MKELECVVQKYAWGKIGFESTVAQLKVILKWNNSIFHINLSTIGFCRFEIYCKS
jgi:hypothetical protein